VLTREAQTVSSSVTNSEGLTPFKNDVGDGIDWVAVSIVDGNLFCDVDENTYPKDRFIQINLNSGKGTEAVISIQQLRGANSLDFSKAQNSQYIPILTLKS